MKTTRYFLLAWLANQTTAFSAYSAFTSRPLALENHAANRRRRTTSLSFTNGLVMYDASHDPPGQPELNAWSVLSNTEKWISGLFPANAGNKKYTRKEISYACETFTDSPMIVAGIFRRLKELREAGEMHGAEQEELKEGRLLLFYFHTDFVIYFRYVCGLLTSNLNVYFEFPPQTNLMTVLAPCDKPKSL
jgi:hypothetical protein